MIDVAQDRPPVLEIPSRRRLAQRGQKRWGGANPPASCTAPSLHSNESSYDSVTATCALSRTDGRGRSRVPKRGAPGSRDRSPATVFACALWLYFVGLETLLSDQPYRDLVTTRAAQAIWELIGGNTDRRIIVNFKDGGDHVGRVVSLEDEVLVLQGESDNLFAIQLADVLSVEVIDPDPLTPSSAL